MRKEEKEEEERKRERVCEKLLAHFEGFRLNIYILCVFFSHSFTGSVPGPNISALTDFNGIQLKRE